MVLSGLGRITVGKPLSPGCGLFINGISKLQRYVLKNALSILNYESYE